MSKLTITMRITLDTAVHTTGNLRRPGVDKAMARAPNGTLALPATTLKGFLREKAEILLRAWGHRVCVGPEPKRLCKGPELCLVCRVFGSPRRPSPLHFSDGHLITEETNPSVRAGVAISRHRRAAFPQRLFFVETTTLSSTQWHARCEGYFPSPNAAEEAAALIALAARWGIAIGGGRTRGLGWIRQIEVEARVDDQLISEVRMRALWQAWQEGKHVAED
ncbi:hypothetical protein HRbin22_00844 [Candidatus Thermoflexus japonica]|uniref:CRISPR type III-associated protein domain-containing protein n=1 Tax=Candidatus Thermoflexus japonica TaxID=2035417 RepID=A0A2H5Y572_9CHLR|nr:hypothetical protein HRbin22_00844 [Candidatus Thermoflexus japonica]